jgi:hypothetical protein
MPLTLSYSGLGGKVKFSGTSGKFKTTYISDAGLFFNRVTAAGGTLTQTERSAVSKLVIDLKSANLWDSMKAIYPMVGATSASCAQNLKSSNFTGAFSGAWVYSNTGAKGDAYVTSTYMNTQILPSTELNITSSHMSIYANSISSTGVVIGNGALDCFIEPGATLLYGSISTPSYMQVASTRSPSFMIVNRQSANTQKLIKNNSILVTQTSTAANFQSAQNILVGAWVPSGNSTDASIAFSSIGSGLSDTQASDLHTIVQTFQTSLYRQYNRPPQTVSDTDAQAFINRVYAAGGLITDLEASAVNQLVISMKAVNVWTKMRAIYPMVGSSFSSCGQNLKSASYTATVQSVLSYSTNGVTPSDPNPIFNTGFPLTALNSINDISYGYYNRINIQLNSSFGFGTQNEFFIRYAGDRNYAYLFDAANDSRAVTDCRGFNAMSRIGSTTKYVQLNNTIDTYTSTSSGTLSSATLNLARGTQGAETGRQNAFGYVSDGLTITELTNLYTTVQAFQTTLGRQV